MKLHEWIKKTISETPGLTQKGLAASVGMNPATVNRMLYGRRHIRAEEVPLIEQYLGQKYQANAGEMPEYTQDKGHYGAFSDGRSGQAFARPEPQMLPQTTIPVRQIVDCGAHTAFTLNQEQVVDWVERHPLQKGSEEAYALYVTSNVFEPRYYIGELVYVHPGRPPAIAQDCLLSAKGGEAYLCRYMGQGAENVLLQDLHTGQDFTLKHQDVSTLCAVVGRG